MKRLPVTPLMTISILAVGAASLHAHAAAPFVMTNDAPQLERVQTSSLTAIALPAKTFRVTPLPEQVTTILKTLISSGGKNVKQGNTEVLLWSGAEIKRDASAVKKPIIASLKAAGWEYEETDPSGKDSSNTVVSLTRTSPTRRGIIGFWTSHDDTLVLGLTEMLPVAQSTAEQETPPPPARDDAETTGAQGGLTDARPGTIQVGPMQRTINLMGNTLPTLPTFAKAAPKAGIVSGYVKDANGHPLKGAVIGVRSSATGGFYSGASGKSDETGYYEISVPYGAAEFYTASCTLDYGEGRAAFGLYPADGEADSFATAKGHVENWVLLPYGVADRDKASDDPKFSGNYLGGTFVVNYFVADPRFPSGTELPEGAEIELTLLPNGPLLDGSKGKTFVLRRRVQDGGEQFYINNVPVGQYRLIAWLIKDGKPSTLKIKETGPNSQKPFGLEPKEADGAVNLTFRPGSAQAGKAAAAHGNWDALSITLSR